MIYAEVLAGGVGKRMGNTDMPKQFLMLGNKPIIIHTLEQFLLHPSIAKVLIGCPAEWISYMNDLIAKYILTHDKIVIIEGGIDRNGTIMNACKYIKDNYGLHDEDVIITHDAVRPFIDYRIIEDNIKASQKYDAVDTIIPATDTIVESLDGNVLSNIPVRDHIYLGQTPQTFKIAELMKTYEALTNEEKSILTDACKIFVVKNKLVGFIRGEEYNMKITTMHDLKLANALLELNTKND
jgi:2-C-methyl-D-erythritol 4-phosphate cytidylyltransferase